MAGPFAPSGRRVAARRRTPGGLGPRARPRPRCGLGLGAALRAGLAARASARPSPHAARAAWWCWRQSRGVPALRAGGGSRPRPLGASLPPPAACGPLPLPTLGGLGAARPARLRRSGLCGGWSPPSAAQVAPLRGLPAASRCSGAPPRAARPGPLRGRAPRGLAPLLPLAGRGVGAPARPGPHSVGAVGPSAPPARAGQATASRPALARLRLCLRWCGSASAWPSRRSGPAPLAASRRRAAGRRPRPLGAARARPQFLRRAQGPCPLCGSRPCPALRARLGRGGAPPAGGTATPEHIRQGQDKPPTAGLA